MDNKDIFDVFEIADNIYRIREFETCTCYLVVGEKKALLIDTANGAGNLRKVVESITNLPVIVALTHAHPDHAGGIFHFSEAYTAKADINFLFKLLLTRFVRTKMLLSSPAKEYGIQKEDVCRSSRKTKLIPFDNGHIFDLGGKIIEVLLTPGHTRGSAIFIDEEAKIVFTGDNVNTGLWMFLPGTTSIEEWIDGAEKTYEIAKDLKPFGGHDDGVQTALNIRTLIDIGKELVRKTKRNTCSIKPRPFPEEGDIRIIYRKSNILKK